MRYFNEIYGHFVESIEGALSEGLLPEEIVPSFYLYKIEESDEAVFISVDSYPNTLENVPIISWNSITQEALRKEEADGFLLFFGVGALIEEEMDSMLFLVYDDISEGFCRSVYTTTYDLKAFVDFDRFELCPNLGLREH